MTFKELKKGYSVFIIKNGDTVEYIQGRVVSDATPPRVDTSKGLVFPQPLVVDVSIESDGTTKIWTLSANDTSADVQSGQNIMITTDKTNALNVLKNIKSESDIYLENVEKYKAKRSKCEELISELDIDFKQTQQTNKRLDTLEQSISDMKTLLTKLYENGYKQNN